MVIALDFQTYLTNMMVSNGNLQLVIDILNAFRYGFFVISQFCFERRNP